MAKKTKGTKGKGKTSSMRDKVLQRAKERENHGQGNSVFRLPPGVSYDEAFYRPEKGTRTFDIIPYVVTADTHPDAAVGEQWYQRTFMIHGNIGAEKKRYICPGTIGKKCPICEMYAKAKTDPSVPEEIVNGLKPRERELFNIIDIENEEERPQLFEMSYHTFGKMLEEEVRERDDETAGFMDLEAGYSLKVRFAKKKLGKAVFLEATRIDFEERDEYDESILDDAFDLDKVLNILDYTELKKILLEVDMDGEDDDDSDDKPGKRAKNKTGKKAKPEPEDDDDDSEEEEASEESFDLDELDSTAVKALKKKELVELAEFMNSELDLELDVDSSIKELKADILEALAEYQAGDSEEEPEEEPEEEEQPKPKKGGKGAKTGKKAPPKFDLDSIEEADIRAMKKKELMELIEFINETDGENLDPDDSPKEMKEAIIEYLFEDEEEEEPEEESEEESEEEDDEPADDECPNDGEFGTDCNKLDECDECPNWEACQDAYDTLKASKKKKESGTGSKGKAKPKKK